MLYIVLITKHLKSFLDFIWECLSQWFASQQGDVPVVVLACPGQKHHDHMILDVKVRLAIKWRQGATMSNEQNNLNCWSVPWR